MKADGRVSNHFAERIRVVERYVRDNMDQALDRGALAAVAGFSVPHFHRLFATCTGQSVGGYVRRERLLRAGRKLRIGAVDITEVALAAGYHSHAAFGKAFKQQFGISPSAFRQLGCSAATAILRKA
jgi:AraC family transcriptional regulator